MKKFCKVFLLLLIVAFIASFTVACDLFGSNDDKSDSNQNVTTDDTDKTDTSDTDKTDTDTGKTDTSDGGKTDTSDGGKTDTSGGGKTDTSDTDKTDDSSDTETKHEHAYGEWEIITPVTCLTIGTQKHTCSCGESETETISALGHDFATEFAIDLAPTCTAKGSQSKHCLRCDEKTEVTEISALGHDEVSHAEQEPTCTEIGWGEYVTCANCNYTTRVDIPAHGHVEEIDESVAATCFSEGWTSGLHCSECGVIVVAQVKIPALGSSNNFEAITVANTIYSDDIGCISYRYSYSISISDDLFNLTTLTVGSDNTYSIQYSSGSISGVDNGIYELDFDEENESLYIRFIESKFEFCQKDGSRWSKDECERIESTIPVDLVPRKGNSVYGYNDLANYENGEDMQALYRRMFYDCEAFIENNDDIQRINGFYILDTIDLSSYAITDSEFISVWKVFVVENPRYYWLSNHLTVEGSFFKFCIDEAYSKADYRVQCDAAINDMIEECNTVIEEGLSNLNITLAIHDFIINRMNYAYKEDGVTPRGDIWTHNIVGCAQYKLGVCESYAETFMLLCKHYGVDVIIVAGTVGDEDHAWNMAEIDGVWYGVDVTWDETNREDSISYDCFGMSKSYCESTHNADSFNQFGIDFLYSLPEMSVNSIELVDLLENGEFVGTYVSIDNAFEHMNDQTADYTVQLYSYGLHGPILIASPDIVHSIGNLSYN